MSEIKNATIMSATLGFESHGILTYWIGLDYGGSVQGFGGDSLDHPHGAKSIRRLLETVGVSSWEKLKGTACRADSDHARVHRIGHYLKDVWFDPVSLHEGQRDNRSARN